MRLDKAQNSKRNWRLRTEYWLLNHDWGTKFPRIYQFWDWVLNDTVPPTYGFGAWFRWAFFDGLAFRCWFSARYWDLHDYPDDEEKGGPAHFIEFTCSKCAAKFTI